MHARKLSFSYSLMRFARRVLSESNSYLCESATPSSRSVFTRQHQILLRRLSGGRSLSLSSTTGKSITSGSGDRHKVKEHIIEELQHSLRGKLSYVFDESVAKKLVTNILCNRVNREAPVLEIAPGIGLVSRELLHHGVEKVIGLETEKAFHPYLQSVQDNHGDGRFEFHSWNMLNVHEKFYKRRSKDGGTSYKAKETEVVNKLSRSTFKDTECPYSVFTIGGSKENHNFVFYILRNLPYEDPVLCKERVEFFFLVHPKFKLCIEEILPTQQPSNYNSFYNYFHTFICLMYDITFLDQFRANDFVPSFSKKNASKRLDASKRYLVKMQLKPDIAGVLPLDQHHGFSLFLRNIFRKRNTRIVPVMEMLVAGSGLHMLADGFTMMETVVDISPDRLLQLYKSMLQWPEYSVSHLKNYIVMKTQGGVADEDHA